MGVFDELNALNINGHTDKKKVSGTELTYLSWPWAWAEVKKRYPDAHYTIWRNSDGLPYTEDPQTGYMVYTSVTIEGITHEMWLPVMDGANKAMKREPYEYMTKYNGKKTCEAATMMDINKTIMRCLVKNLAMFGLGLYIYAGEDIPEGEKEEEKIKVPEPTEPAFTRPAPANSDVTKVEVIPQNNFVRGYLLAQMGAMKENRGISSAENNKIFKAQYKALVEAGLAPDKKIDEYTMEEAEALIDAMYKNFTTTGTELIK